MELTGFLLEQFFLMLCKKESAHKTIFSFYLFTFPNQPTHLSAGPANATFSGLLMTLLSIKLL